MEFIAGIELSRRFYWEAVRPIIEHRFPNLAHAAARIGAGSDVLGFDTVMSTDHDWGPMVSIFVREEEAALAPTIHEHLRHTLPHEFAGYPVGTEEAEDDPGVRRMQAATAGPVNHRVTVTTLRQFVGWDYEQPMGTADWLTVSSQRLRELTSGAVHHDGVGDLAALRERLAFYPHDVWLYLLAAGWTRIGQEEHLMARAGYVGDELGSALIGSRLVRDIMTLCFLMERQYAPYPKWFGTAFATLRCADELQPLLWQAQIAPTWPQRETALCSAYTTLARMHNALALTAPLDTSTRSFFGRPFQIIGGERFADALRERIMDPEVQRVARQRLIGSIDQWSDSTDLRAHSVWQPAIRQLYDVPEPTGKEHLMLNETDLEHLRTAIAIAARARDNGNHPFGALLVGADGAVLAEGENTNITAEDITGHAEINLARLAFKHFDGATLQAATMYASTEPCAMCAGAIYWAGIGRVVFALSGSNLAAMASANDNLLVPCRDVLSRGEHPVVVEGPFIEDEARIVHENFW